jgi:RNA polymerase sigma factor (sigma-70 family)
MTSDPLEDLLEQLCRGDDAAAEQVFVTYAPYLRLLVRRQLPAQLRPKFDSVDVVQSIWADLLQGFRQAGWRFTDVAQLRAFLITATRNRFIDRVRQYQPEAARVRDAGDELEQFVSSSLPHPSEMARADELWERMLALCPPDHHEVLRLRRQGYSLVEVASRTGLHEGSVRRILRTLARRLAFQETGVRGRESGDGSQEGRVVAAEPSALLTPDS